MRAWQVSACALCGVALGWGGVGVGEVEGAHCNFCSSTFFGSPIFKNHPHHHPPTVNMYLASPRAIRALRHFTPSPPPGPPSPLPLASPSHRRRAFSLPSFTNLLQRRKRRQDETVEAVQQMRERLSALGFLKSTAVPPRPRPPAPPSPVQMLPPPHNEEEEEEKEVVLPPHLVPLPNDAKDERGLLIAAPSISPSPSPSPLLPSVSLPKPPEAYFEVIRSLDAATKEALDMYGELLSLSKKKRDVEDLLGMYRESFGHLASVARTVTGGAREEKTEKEETTASAAEVVTVVPSSPSPAQTEEDAETVVAGHQTTASSGTTVGGGGQGEEEEVGEEEEESILATLLEKYSDLLVGLVERKVDLLMGKA